MYLSDGISDLLTGMPTAMNVLLVAGITLALSLFALLMVSSMKRYADKTTMPWDNILAQSVGAPLQWLIWIVGISLAFNAAQWRTQAMIMEMAGLVRDLGVIVVTAWFLIRFIRQAQSHIVASRLQSGKPVDQATVDAAGKISCLTVFVIAVLVAMQTLGFSVAGVLTFGGVGGIAVGFAAKDLLSNFFGGLFIYLDRPFSVGDWVRSPDREIEGTVERIGWRVTRIRKFDSRPLYVPNSAFSTISVENPSRMTNRRINETIGIRYDDASAMEGIVIQVTAYLKSHDAIDQEQTLMVNFKSFAPSSLDFSIYCFTRTRSVMEFNRIKQEILLQVLKIIADNHAECAFPTTTVHLQGNIPRPEQIFPQQSSR